MVEFEGGIGVEVLAELEGVGVGIGEVVGRFWVAAVSILRATLLRLLVKVRLDIEDTVLRLVDRGRVRSLDAALGAGGGGATARRSRVVVAEPAAERGREGGRVGGRPYPIELGVGGRIPVLDPAEDVEIRRALGGLLKKSGGRRGCVGVFFDGEVVSRPFPLFEVVGTGGPDLDLILSFPILTPSSINNPCSPPSSSFLSR